MARLVRGAAAGVLAATVVALSLWSLRAAAEPREAGFFGETLVGLDGAPAPLAALRGKPLVVNFWARWCAPCRVEMPQLSAYAARYKRRGVELLGVAVEDKPEVVQAFVRAYGVDYPVVVAGPRGVPLLQLFGDTTAGLPYTVVFDRRGNVVFRKLGALGAAEMETAFSAALAD
ncbi:MAG: TlpA family protein disulfide reductase [Ignavibacteria bacterium]